MKTTTQQNKTQVDEPESDFERWTEDGQIDEQDLIVEIDMFYGRPWVKMYESGYFNRNEDGTIEFPEQPDNK